MLSLKKQALRGFGSFIAILSLAIISQQLWHSWAQIAKLQLQILPAFFAFLLACFNLLLYGFLWQKTLLRLGSPLKLAVAIRIWLLSQIVRYAPGNVWHLLGRAYLAQQEGVETQPLSYSVVLELLQGVVAGLLITTLSLPFWPHQNGFALWTLLLIPLLGFYLFPQLLQYPFTWIFHQIGQRATFIKIRRRDLFLLLPGYCANWLIHGGVLYLLAHAIYPLPLKALPAMTGIFALAWVIGFLSFVTPSGLGVREGVLSYLLSFLLPTPVALLLALLSRVGLTAAELCCTAFAFCWKKR